MDILYSVDEKYLQAIEELRYGELPKALHLFHELIVSDPSYARAYFQLGYLYHYDFSNYQTAGYYYKKCVELEPQFPDVYEHYLKVVITLDMPVAVKKLAEKALQVPGVNKASIFENLGLHAEECRQLEQAADHYKKAYELTLNDSNHTQLKEHLRRVNDKQGLNRKLVYSYQG